MPGGHLNELLKAISHSSTVSVLLGILGAAGAALVGRALYIADQARIKKKAIWTWRLLLELPIALGMGLIGGGLAEWLDLGGVKPYALVAALAYLGPQGIEAMANELIRRNRR